MKRVLLAGVLVLSAIPGGIGGRAATTQGRRGATVPPNILLIQADALVWPWSFPAWSPLYSRDSLSITAWLKTAKTGSAPCCSAWP